jgi:hypothetical protein
MYGILKQTWAVALAGIVGFGFAVPSAHAQFRQRTLPLYSSGVSPNMPFYNPVNPMYRAAPGMTMQQAMFNQYQALSAAASLPPWMYGYNPYPSPIIATPPVLPYQVPAYGAYPSFTPYPYGSAAYGTPFGVGVSPYIPVP